MSKEKNIQNYRKETPDYIVLCISCYTLFILTHSYAKDKKNTWQNLGDFKLTEPHINMNKLQAGTSHLSTLPLLQESQLFPFRFITPRNNNAVKILLCLFCI